MSHASTAKLLEILNITLPILQAPMAGTSSPAMAAAVSEAGGLGALGLGAAGAEGARKMIAEFSSRSNRPLNVNLFTHKPAVADKAREAAWIERARPLFAAYNAKPPQELSEIYTSFLVDDAMLALLLEVKPAVISLHFGLPDARRLAALRGTGAVLLATVTSLAEAQQAEAAGIHALVAQGYEAGGHRGTFDQHAPDDRLGTMALTRLLAAHSTLPVIAAGGIMDGAGIDAALALGAAAAQLGTAYVGTDESLADAGYRAALFSDAANHTIMTSAISGRPARCLANRFTALGQEVNAADIPAYPITYDLGKSLHAAAKAAGEFGYGAQWAGQGAPLARKLSAGTLTRTLAAEMHG
jgi:nitronate monooxygenase